jgi:SAM-dependent methyltransferase
MEPARSPGVPGRRSAEEIAATLAFRARRGAAHFAKLIEEGPARACPVCGYEGRFSPVRHKPGIWCPSCDSRPRHRLFQLWLEREGLPEGARVLHFAAEPLIDAWLRPRVAEYVTADINDRYEAVIDITAMDLPDERFDAVIANHVLEHVDDRAALAEMARVLAPGGLAILTVPLVEGWEETLERAEWTSAQDRARYYTDPAHLRLYGRDFRERIAAAGLAPSEFTALEPDVSRHGLHRGEKIFFGRKPG